MNPWEWAAAALLLCFPPCLRVLWKGGMPDRLAALQMSGIVSVLFLLLLCVAFRQPSFVDLPVALAFLSLPGVLALIHFMERWL